MPQEQTFSNVTPVASLPAATQQTFSDVSPVGVSGEESTFLKENPGYKWMAADPKFPHRPEGIYPTGPGNEWRNDPSFAQSPVDLHLARHTYQGAKAGAMAATAPLALEASLPQLVGGAVGGVAGGTAGQLGAKKLGAGEAGQEVASDVGGIVGGGMGAGVADAAAVKAKAFYEALPPEVQKALLGVLSPRLKEGLGLVDALTRPKAAAEPPTAVEPQPAAALAQGAKPYVDPAAALGQIPARYSPPGAAGSMVESVTAPEVANPEPMAKTASGQNIPRMPSGEEALTAALDAQGNANLLKIARSRGIDVSRESQLKPGVGDKLLIAKIYDDFSPEEIEDMRRTFIETQATRANMDAANPGIWSKVGAEANKTLSLQTYFPDVKIPAATLRRTQSAIATAKTTPEGASTPDLLNILKKSLEQAQQRKAAQP